MNFEELINQRQSCRKFSDTPVEKEKLEKIAEMARLSPSACNSQPWRMHIVRGDCAERFSSYLRDFGMNGFTKNVTTFIAVSELNAKLKPGSKLKYDNDHFVKYDVGQFIAYITLAAQELGLATCILGWLNNKKLLKFSKLKKGNGATLLLQ